MISAAYLLGEERCLVWDHQFHLVEDAELLRLLGRQNRVVAPIDVQQVVGAGIGDIQEVRAVIGRAQRCHLVGRRGPAPVLAEVVLHRLLDGMAVRVVRRQIGGFFVFAEVLQHYRTDRRSRGLPVEVLTEAVAHAVLAGGVV